MYNKRTWLNKENSPSTGNVGYDYNGAITKLAIDFLKGRGYVITKQF